jgi:hypothetical protein
VRRGSTSDRTDVEAMRRHLPRLVAAVALDIHALMQRDQIGRHRTSLPGPANTQDRLEARIRGVHVAHPRVHRIGAVGRGADHDVAIGQVPTTRPGVEHDHVADVGVAHDRRGGVAMRTVAGAIIAPPVVLASATSMQEASAAMLAARVQAAVLADEGKICGLITAPVVARGGKPLGIRVDPEG